ncbi:MAG: beta-Ala-His dipeptidase [Finegoldia magna]|nr:beta-Ala-His dipeptidase [Finegoldia magna]
MNKFNSINDLKEVQVLRNFLMLTEIPRPSFKEKKVSDFLKNWAEKNNLEVKQDDKYNLVIMKDGQKGGEKKKPLILQAHIDMVCQKKDDFDFDFDKDPIPVQIDGDELNTGGKTTLGADNGLGVAIIMSVLEDKEISHPPIRAILTTVEEDDFSGVNNLSKDWVIGDRAINIDNSQDNEIIAGSNGGMGVTFSLYINRQERKFFNTFKIKVGGLLGGHSGEDIEKGRGNAIILLSRLLEKLEDKIELLDIEGGTFRLAIPREAYAIIGTNLDKNKLDNILKEFEEELHFEYSAFSDIIYVNSEDIALDKEAISPEDLDKIINIIKLYPNGIFEVDPINHVVISSNNLGELRIENNTVNFFNEIRAIEKTQVEYTLNKISTIANIFEGKVEGYAKYPGWRYDPESKLRNDYKKIFERELDEKIEVKVSAAGLESGYLLEKNPNLDIISVGPNHTGLHSPSESANIPSIIKFYETFKVFLREID